MADIPSGIGVAVLGLLGVVVILAVIVVVLLLALDDVDDGEVVVLVDVGIDVVKDVAVDVVSVVCSGAAHRSHIVIYIGCSYSTTILRDQRVCYFWMKYFTLQNHRL